MGKDRLAEGGTRYAAFLSYSHKDAATARLLHRRLESYRMPRRLAGTDGARGTVPTRIAPVFRDREELPAASDLSESVQAALAASEALVVICSPAAAHSRWVAREIETFVSLHPDAPVLAAIVDGEPPDCLPEALLLRGPDGSVREPLAADLRPAGDGRQLGLLKLVAGIAGVGLDALVQRDAQRRVRRVTAITVLALLAALMMAGLAALALQARSEAERQRQEAEGLIEFMLTDLRDRLQAVGRLDVLTSANDRALDYYRDQRLEGLPPDSLERRARILHAMGEDDERRGQRDEALAKFGEAARTTASLLAADPDRPERIFAHAQSEYWLGYVAYLQEDWPRAAQHWLAYKRLADRLVAAAPDEPRWLRESGYAEGNLCTLELARAEDPARALGHCQAALARMERVATLRRQDRQSVQDVANRYAWLADAWRAHGDTGRQLVARRRHEAMVRGLVERHPEDMDLQDQWLRTLLAVSETLRDQGRGEEAARYRRQARRLADRLLRHDPENERWRIWSRRIGPS